MLKEILAVSGKPGLFKLVSKGSNMSIIESLIDKKRIPAYARDKMMYLSDITFYTNDEDVSIRDILTTIKEKEGGKKVSIDLAKAQPDEFRNYFAEILPNYDRERVYVSDIKKLLKWYDLLIANDITDFVLKEEEGVEETPAEEVESSADDDKKSPKAKSTKATASKRSDMTSAKTVNAPKAKSTPKTSTPKKNVVGAKRGG
jgi:hypothetical protein